MVASSAAMCRHLLRERLVPQHVTVILPLRASISSSTGAASGCKPGVLATFPMPRTCNARPTSVSPRPFSPEPVVFHACTALEFARLMGGLGRRRGMAIARHMTEDEYNNTANELLDDILDKLEVIEDSMEGFEVNASGDGVIHVIVADKGTWVLNKQTPSRQIWLSSPITGPTHYKMVDDEWVCTKDGHKMVHRLREQLYIQL